MNRPLTNMSVAFMQSAENFVASRVFSNINSGFQSDLYYSYPRGEFNRIMMKKRAPGAPSAGASYNVETQSFLAEVQALHRDIPDQIRANQDNPINLDSEAMRFLSLQALLQEREGLGQRLLQDCRVDLRGRRRSRPLYQLLILFEYD